jgi:amino acid adenylation domain-containing protein/non-ribosomal peptide synthase protein (TIGR01720 family)
MPIDPEYPTERKGFILADTQTPILLTQQHLAPNLPTDGIKVICLDTDLKRMSSATSSLRDAAPTTNAQQQIYNPVNETTALNLAYVIYTSGSTGKPKGTLIPHRGLVNYLSWCTQAYGVKEGAGTLVHSPLGFDLTITSLFSPLLVGNQVEILPEDQGIETLSNSLRHHSNLSLVKITPAHLELLNQQFSPQEVANLTKAFIIGGENLLAENIAFWQEFAPETILVNEYGPTETVVGCCIYQVPTGKHLSGSIPIGRPIANTQIYILDQNLQPVPIGVPGELHIGGAGLARGYLNRPELTQEKFILNPFDNSKLYKTGDLARYLADGNIEYLGRIDNQVKIRGFRIELGEIESALSQHEDVQVSIVIAREDIPGNKRLVAYIVPQAERTVTVSELRRFLKSKLPEYMVPSAIVILESLPLTPNGKIDRRALPVPESRTGIEVSLIAPRSAIEEKLAVIWQQVLRVEKVGIDDNFFELGGDSILSIQIISRAKQASIEITLKELFANQTIAQLATVAGTTKALQMEQGLVTGAVSLTPIQHWFFEQKSSKKHHYNQSFLLSVPANIKGERLEQVWQQLLKHHDALRLRFSQTDVTWQQIYAAPDDSNAISLYDLSTLPDSEQKTSIEATASQLQASLNLDEKLVQVALFRLGNDKRARLLIVIHHLLIDGVSWRILLEDLQTAYEQLSLGQAIQLPAKTTSFKDWVRQLTEYAQSNRLKTELAYWLSASECAISPLPVDYAQGVNTVASTSTISVPLNFAQTQALLQDVPKAYKTQINDVLLTALVLVVSRWTNSQSVLFNLEGHGREDIIDDVDLSRTIGWFTTIFPVVLKLEAIDKDNIGNTLKSVKEQLRAIPNKGIGYGLLRYLSREPEIAAQLETLTEAEISFNYMGQFAQVLNKSSVMQLATESSGQSQSLQGQRPYLLDINAIILNEQLQVDWTYSSNIYRHTTIENIAQEFVKTLQELITHCLSPENGGYTPTDFPLVKFNQLELDQILANL